MLAGSNGMGQAQSQSLGGDCGDCFGTYGIKILFFRLLIGKLNKLFLFHLEGRDGHPDPLKSVSSSSNGYPQTQTSSTGRYDDGYRRPTQTGGVGRETNQSRNIKIINVPAHTLTENINNIQADIYGNVPPANGFSTDNRPIGDPHNLNAGGISRQPGSLDNIPKIPGTNIPIPTQGVNTFPGM